MQGWLRICLDVFKGWFRVYSGLALGFLSGVGLKFIQGG